MIGRHASAVEGTMISSLEKFYKTSVAFLRISWCDGCYRGDVTVRKS